jgi:hypothetical protein
VFAAEHLFDLAGLDLARQRIQAAAELGQRIGISLLGPLHENREIVAAAPQRGDELAIFFEPPPPLKQLLSLFLVFPEIRLADSRLDPIQLLFRFGDFKDSSEDRLLAWRDPDTSASVHRVR